jgi:hypothetical protein
MPPINISTERCNYLANRFGCKMESLPFYIPWSPMGTTKPRIEHFINIIERVDRRLSGIASILSYDGRLIVTKTLIMSMLSFAMCTLKVPLTIIDHIEGSARGFF